MLRTLRGCVMIGTLNAGKQEGGPPASAVVGAVTAFGLWGVLPVYWKAIAHIGSDLAVAHRVVWTLATVVPLLLWRGEFRTWAATLRRPRIVGIHTWSALLLGVNWSTFVWAAHHGHIVECSVGYFINPMLNVLIGFLFLGERVNLLQMASIALAAAGVCVQMALIGHVPWIALVLAFSMAFYGLARRLSPEGSLSGLATETLVTMPLAIGYLAWSAEHGANLFGTGGARDVALLLGLGVITAVPLLGFAHAARKLPFALLGVLQFLAPTGQFLTGAVLYREPVSGAAIASFVLIWVAVAVFCMDLWQRRK